MSAESGEREHEDALDEGEDGGVRFTTKARAVHAGARSTVMYHSGCTPRQRTPFEMCFMRQTISRLPRGRVDLVRSLANR